MQIVKPEPNDAIRIATLIRDNISFNISSNTSGLKITDCHGYHHYVEDNIRLVGLGTNTRYLIVKHDNDIIGCTEIKLLQGAIFNNYTVKDPKFENIKIGGKLKYAVISYWANQDFKYILGDAFIDNENSCSFYKRNGFEEVERNYWFLIDQPKSNKSESFTVNELSQAEIIHHRYGFSHFNILTSKGSYTVGRIGDSIYRLRDFSWYNDDAFLTALKIICPNRKLLVIANEGSQPENLKPLTISIRFKCEIEIYKENLERLGYDKI